MKSSETSLSSRAAELARAFDDAFAEAPQPPASQRVDVLAIRLGGAAYALRLPELAGVFARRTIRALPSPLPELLGLVSIRAAILPVYDLAALLGLERREAPWLVVAAQAPVAFAFEDMEGYWRLPSEAIVPAAPGTTGGAISELVQSAEALRPVIHLPVLLSGIAARTDQAKKEKGSSSDVRTLDLR
jgi:chemotaxis signal transduction protein